MAHPMSSSSSTPTALQSSFSSLTLEHTLEDLSARFIVNLPAEELESMDRVCFQIEQAHWYYEDFVRPAATNPSLLPSYSLKAFSLLLFRSCPLLHDLIADHQRIWTSFMAYKERVPVCGAILINQHWDKVLLVKGWAKGASWSFPRGKINKHEAEGMCAVREVLEETGYDLSESFPPEQLQPGWVEDEGSTRDPYYVELVIKEQKIRLYFIPNVHEDTFFETRTRKEISKIDWFRVSDLPTWSKDKKAKAAAQPNSTAAKAKYYMVTPFISHLKLWIERHKPKNLPLRQTKQRQAKNIDRDTQRPAVNPLPQLSDYNPPPFESDFDAPSTSPSIGSTEDETDLEADARRRRPQFDTTEQGTMALNAFFFGADPGAVNSKLDPSAHFQSDTDDDGVRLDPPPVVSDPSRGGSHNSTPPHVAYERQQSVVQPRPKPTSQHTSNLLALLRSQTAGAKSPANELDKPQVASKVESGNRALLDLLNGSTSREAPSDITVSPAPADAQRSLLLEDSAAPREAQGFGVEHVPLDTERGDEERNEKRQALMRALFSVGSRTPPMQQPTPDAQEGGARRREDEMRTAGETQAGHGVVNSDGYPITVGSDGGQGSGNGWHGNSLPQTESQQPTPTAVRSFPPLPFPGERSPVKTRHQLPDEFTASPSQAKTTHLLSIFNTRQPPPQMSPSVPTAFLHGSMNGLNLGESQQSPQASQSQQQYQQQQQQSSVPLHNQSASVQSPPNTAFPSTGHFPHNGPAPPQFYSPASSAMYPPFSQPMHVMPPAAYAAPDSGFIPISQPFSSAGSPIVHGHASHFNMQTGPRPPNGSYGPPPPPPLLPPNYGQHVPQAFAPGPPTSPPTFAGQPYPSLQMQQQHQHQHQQQQQQQQRFAPPLPLPSAPTALPYPQAPHAANHGQQTSAKANANQLLGVFNNRGAGTVGAS